jgi:hypothetical protein
MPLSLAPATMPDERHYHASGSRHSYAAPFTRRGAHIPGRHTGRQVRVELPEEPPQLTPDAARALLRMLVKAHAAWHGRQEVSRVTDHQGRSASGPEGKG